MARTVPLCTYQCRAGGGGGGKAGHGVGIVSSPDVDIFDYRLGRRSLTFRNMFLMFPPPRLTHTVWKDLEIMEANGNERKLSGFHCFDFKF